LCGLPVSAFLHANPGEAAAKAGSPASSAAAGTVPPASVSGKGTKNYVPLWTGTATLGNSVIYETGGNVGVGTKTPKAPFDVVGSGTTGIEATAPGTNAAILGTATATTGGTTGVAGISSDPNGNGVYGINNATTGGAGTIGLSKATSGSSTGVFGQSASTAGTGVFGNETAKTGGVFGVLGMAVSTGQYSAGVSGVENATTGVVSGVAGETSSTTNGAAGVGGFEGSSTGQVFGVSGSTNSATNFAAGVSGNEGAVTGQVYGVVGVSNSTTNGAAAVNGYEPATTGGVYGVYGSTPSTGSGAAGVNGFEGATTGQVFGVVGQANSTTDGAAAISGNEGGASGNTRGVQGNVVSTSGYAVYGDAAASTGFTVGVFGDNHSTGGVGVLGKAQAAGGIAGQFANTAGSGLILQGVTGSTFKQVFSVDASGNGSFSGNLNVTGKLTKGSGSFKIDHPLDPANKYLSHSFVESPDMMNVYNGNITTDRHGLATVNLPDYFEALNGDFRYQLTVIGQFAQAIVARKISANRFVIRTSKPNVEVSWQVTGIRHDAYANQYRIPVEEDKPVGEQGYYLHPEVFGQPESKSISAAGKSGRASQEVMADATHN
jgi:hypothetical protein